jgi:hypothetical protein
MRWWRGSVAVAVVVALASGCAGPTYSESALRSQASRSASSAVSELETIRLVVTAQLSGDSWWQYTDVVVTDSESALTAIESTFASRQPPNAESTRVRFTVVEALGDAVSLAEAVRIAVRHDDLPKLRLLSAKIPKLVNRLNHLAGSVA